MKFSRLISILIFTGYIPINLSAEDHSFTGISMDTIKSPVEYINSNFENASRLFWEYNPDGSVVINPLYDHERNSPNRASNHWHFQVQAKAGSDVTLYIQYFDEVWNGNKVESYSLVKSYYISEDGKTWRTIPAEVAGNKSHKLQIHMDSNSLFIAGVEPYRLSDLDKLLADIRGNTFVEITPIGKTVEGRTLEIVRVGNPDAPYSVFLRARAHPWEPGGNWVVQGLIRSLLEKDAERYLKRYCVYILPMSNKDGVSRGLTRFNSQGKDLNRNWDVPPDPLLAPENFALEKWFRDMIAKGKKPRLAMDLHNDRGGNLHISRPNVNLDKYLANMQKLESLMYKYTWFTEGSTGKDFRVQGSFGEGLVERYGIDACILELNQTWIKGLNKQPFGKDWELLGRQMRDVFFYYFDGMK